MHSTATTIAHHLVITRTINLTELTPRCDVIEGITVLFSTHRTCPFGLNLILYFHVGDALINFPTGQRDHKKWSSCIDDTARVLDVSFPPIGDPVRTYVLQVQVSRGSSK